METIDCYRFVQEDLTSANGEMSWRVGEWNAVEGTILCCSSGLHASLTPRDSLRHVYGQRWFTAQARGEISRQGDKFAASEMRLVEEIPAAALRRFAVWCAKDGLDRLERRDPLDGRIGRCIQATEGYLDGELPEKELLEARRGANDLAASGAYTGAGAGRVAVAAIAASCAANGDAASWAATAAAAAYAAHVAVDAIEAAEALVLALAAVGNVASAAAAARAADHVAAAAHIAAAAGAGAHAATVAAARGTYPADTASDPYFSAFSAFAAHPADTHYLAQNTLLLELISNSRAQDA